MSNNKKVVSDNHVSVKRRKATIKQIKARIELLEDYINQGAPTDFDAHLTQKALLEYVDKSKGISRLTRMPVKKEEVVLDTGVSVNALEHLDYLRNELIKTTEARAAAELETEEQEVKSTKNETKALLRDTINDKDRQIKLLCNELAMQRSAYNQLFNFMKEHMPNNKSMLRAYYNFHQEELLEIRLATSPILGDLANNVTELKKHED